MYVRLSICMEKPSESIIGEEEILLCPSAPKSLNSIEKYNHSTTIILCYNSTNAKDEIDLIIWHNELYSFVWSIPKHNVHIIGVNMNAQIRKDEKKKRTLLTQLVK